MASTTLLYIAWPLTLGLSYMAGSMILSKNSISDNAKDGNQPSKVMRRNSFSNGSTTENSAATNRGSSTTRSRAGQNGYAKSENITEIANNSDRQKRLTKLLSMIDQLGPNDVEQVLADSSELDMTGTLRFEYRLLLNALAKINPGGALAYVKENIKSSYQSSFASTTILKAWAGYAPDAATQWVKLNHEGDDANPFLLVIIQGIAKANPERATNILQELSFSSERGKALRAIIPHVSKLGTEKANAWLANIEDEKLRSYATTRLASSLALKDPQATANWLKTLSADSLNASAASVAQAWAAQDIDKAAEWTSSLEGETRTSAAQKVIRKYVSSDPNKAATWMKSMSGDPGYQGLVNSYMYSTMPEHPKIALANLDQVDDDQKRFIIQRHILESWTNKDKAAALQWKQSNKIK